MNRRAVGLAMAAGLLGSALAPDVAGAQQIPVRAGRNASSLVGVDFELPIVIDMSGRTEKLGSFALTVRWNPAVLEILGGHEGTFGSIAVNDDSLAAGTLFISGANPAGVSGEVSVVVARMRPLVSDTTSLRIQLGELYAATTFANLTSSATVTNGQYCPAVGRYGDIDADGSANSRDGLIALSASVGLSTPGFNTALGDVDGDGVTRARDALIILSSGVGLDVSAFRVYFVAPGPCATAPTAPGITIDPGSLTVLAGQGVQFGASARDASGASVALTDVFWRSSNERVATVLPDGGAIALDTGTTVISALRRATADSAGITLTVVASRKAHWVDAFHYNERNQLGTQAYPFSSIQDAVDLAAAGDTVYVQPARYGPFEIHNSVVVYGILAAAGPSPVAGASAAVGDMPVIATQGYSYETGVYVSGGAQVELHNLDLDTLYQGVSVEGAGTVLLQNLRHRVPHGTYYSNSVFARSTSALVVRQSHFYGSGTASDGMWIPEGVGSVTVEGTVFAEFQYSGMDVGGAGSVDVRNSVFRRNEGYYYDLHVYGGDVVLSGNRFESDVSTSVLLDWVRSARLDHNVIRNHDGTAIEVYGTTTYYTTPSAVAGVAAAAGDSGVVTLRGDSIHVQWGDWLQAWGYDSLALDSVYVLAEDAWADLDGGRITTMRDTRIDALDWSEMYVYGDSARLVMRNVTINGPDSTVCNRCGYGVDAGGVWIDADSVTMTNLWNAFQLWDGSIALRNSTFIHNGYDVEVDCGSLAATNVTSSDAYYSINVYGCSPDSVVVDQSSFTRGDEGVYADYATARISNSTFTDVYWPIEAYGGDFTATGNTILRPGSEGIYYWAGSDTLSATITGNTVTCVPNMYAWGIEASDATMLVADNVVTDCYEGLVLDSYWAAPTKTVRNNTVTLPADSSGADGIMVSGDGHATIVGNTVTGRGYYGSIYLYDVSSAVVDSNAVSESGAAGIYAAYVDSLRIRDNVVTNHRGAGCCVSGPSGAILVYGADPTYVDTAVVRRNRITGSSASGIVLAMYDTTLVIVDSNTVKGASLIGIWVGASYGADRAWLRWNAVDSTGTDGVMVSSYPGPGAVLLGNNITRSGRSAGGGYGVNNYYQTYTIDAANNWWGDALGPSGSLGDPASTGDSVSAMVTFAPWLAERAATPTPAPPMLLASGTPAAVSLAGLGPPPARNGPPERHRPAPRTPRWLQVPEATAAVPAAASAEVPEERRQAEAQRMERHQAVLEWKRQRAAGLAVRAEEAAGREATTEAKRVEVEARRRSARGERGQEERP